ncbi:molybdenum cofactor guanylyltransferase [Sphingomonas sp.]|uniref:molybdenum cofactor guanylyltransferase n=1 Tax=Sphingomonas sp. TaxID=28214 RepID=UPI000DB786C4|nr:molybdenum cofactor guanylyltransferase [Sphingomonas sp.]PZU07242.1 MAG: molybdenum cofactor guanylyltransferase [Sphingomonas sp.]
MTGILGAILAGGQSRRFGSDKAEALLDGRRLIDWARDGLQGHVERIVICGRADGIPDRPHAGLGPLGGINAALHHARVIGLNTVITVPCDAPALPDGIIARLCASSMQAHLAALPVVGRWDVGWADLLDQHLEGPERSIRGWACRIGSMGLEGGSGIANINTREDLERMIFGDGGDG